MTSIRKAALACVASALIALPLTAAAQGPVNQDTFFTFSQSVELPGKTLPAGTYFFQLADSPSNRHIVKVMSQDRKQLHATLLAIPFYSNERPSDDPQVRFMETPAQAASGAANTNAIKIWFYPGNSVGHEFIYPRSQAMRIASRTGQPVLTTKTDVAVESNVADADLTRVDRTGVDTAVDTSNRSAAQTTAQTSTTTPPATTTTPTQTTAQAQPRPAPMPQTETRTPEPRPTPAPATERADTAPRTDLPNTASLLPLLALIGIGSLVGSRLMRRSRRV
jgi:hypothetical protein